MNKQIIKLVRWFIQFVVIIVVGIVFIHLMNMISLFYIDSRIDEIIYAILYATGVISVHITILHDSYNNTQEK
ncbi:MAG: hypothetical protein KH355_11950 [Clostridiales bacterium]|nr:hypothetical protein [Clostridiales bacterium]